MSLCIEGQGLVRLICQFAAERENALTLTLSRREREQLKGPADVPGVPLERTGSFGGTAGAGRVFGGCRSEPGGKEIPGVEHSKVAIGVDSYPAEPGNLPITGNTQYGEVSVDAEVVLKQFRIGRGIDGGVCA